MKYLLLLLIILITSTQFAKAQEIEMYNSGEDATISLKADLTSFGADAILYLHRSDDLGKSLIRFDLNELEHDRQASNFSGEDYWDLGVKPGDKFQLSYYTATKNIDGSTATEVKDAIVVDQARGRAETFEVEIPQGTLRVGNNITIRENGEKAYFENGEEQDFHITSGENLNLRAEQIHISTNYGSIPPAEFDNEALYPKTTSNTLGTYCSPWTEIWGKYFIIPLEECGRELNFWDTFDDSMASIFRLMEVDTYQGLTEFDEPILKIDPRSFALQFPEAIHTEQMVSEDESEELIEVAAGIKIDALIPILIQSIKEQQEMITAIQLQLNAQK